MSTIYKADRKIQGDQYTHNPLQATFNSGKFGSIHKFTYFP